MNGDDELRYLRHGPQSGEKAPEIGTVRFIAETRGDAGESLAKVKQIMIWWLLLPPAMQHDVETVRCELPQWFASQFRRERSEEEKVSERNRWRKLSESERREDELSGAWLLSGWVYWMVPDNRTWWWWDATVLSRHHCVITAVVREWPFPWGSLRALCRACGFNELKLEE